MGAGALEAWHESGGMNGFGVTVFQGWLMDTDVRSSRTLAQTCFGSPYELLEIAGLAL